MFTPPKKNNQSGGVYTGVSDGETYTIPQDTMDLLAQLSGIQSFAEMSSFMNFNSLNTEQVSHLIDVLGNNILNDNNLINGDSAEIEAIKSEINTPVTGLQALLDTAAQNYSTSLINYFSTVRSFSTNSELMSSLSGSIEYLSKLDAEQMSTVSIYNDQYSTLYLEMLKVSETLSGQISQRDRLISMIDTTQTEYEPAVLEQYLQSTISSITLLSHYSTVQGDTSLTDLYFSTAIHNAQSTIDGYSIERTNVQSTFNYYNSFYNTLKTSTQDEFANLFQNVETFYKKALKQVENQLLSYQYQIQEWSAFVGYLVSNLVISKTHIALLKNGISAKSFLVTATTGQPTVTTGQPTVTTGQPTATTGQPTVTTEQPTATTGQPTVTTGQPTGGSMIGGQVSQELLQQYSVELSIFVTSVQNTIDTLNVLDISFNNILDICSSEMLERQKYISICRNISIIEGNVMVGNSDISDVTTSYNTFQKDLENSAININIYKQKRLNLSAAITDVLNIQISLINDYINNKLVVIPDTGLYTTTKVTNELVLPDPISTDSTPFALDPTVYQIFDPLFSNSTSTVLPVYYSNSPQNTSFYNYNLINVFNAIPSLGSFTINTNDKSTVTNINIYSIDTTNKNNDTYFSTITPGSLLHIVYKSINTEFKCMYTINTIVKKSGYWSFIITYISGNIDFSQAMPIACLLYFSVLPTVTQAPTTRPTVTQGAVTTLPATTSK